MEKEYRVKKNTEIEQIIKGKRRIGNQYLTLYYKKSETNHFRLAVSVSKKIGDAVTRNHEKRRIREIFRQYKAQMLPYDILVVSKKESLIINLNELNDSIYKLLTTYKLIKETQ